MDDSLIVNMILGIHMKLFMNKNEKYEEPEVHMFFQKQTKEVEQVEKFVSSLSITSVVIRFVLMWLSLE